MADIPPSGTRIVPIMAARRTATPRPAANGLRSSVRQRALRGEKLEKETLYLPSLDQLNLYAAPIKGDGNCLFYCLSDQLYGMTDQHGDIRARLVEYMRERRDYFIQFVADVGGERRAPRRAVAEQAKLSSSKMDRAASEKGQQDKFEEMLTKMGKQGCWGGSVEIQAFCQAYEKEVKVYSDFGIQTFTSDLAQSDATRGVIHLAYHSFQHYSSVRNKKGPHEGLPNIPNSPRNGVNGIKRESEGSKEAGDLPSISSPQHLTLAEPWKISTIAEALPKYDYDTIRAMLTKCRGDIDNAFATLLDSDPSTLGASSPPPSVPPTANAASSPSGTLPTQPRLPRSSRTYLGSASRSSSRHSNASKRSADDSDVDADGGTSAPLRRRQGRGRKRRILQDVTLGISVRDEEENDVISIRLRVDPEAVAEQAESGRDAKGEPTGRAIEPSTSKNASERDQLVIADSEAESDATLPPESSQNSEVTADDYTNSSSESEGG